MHQQFRIIMISHKCLYDLTINRKCSYNVHVLIYWKKSKTTCTIINLKPYILLCNKRQIKVLGIFFSHHGSMILAKTQKYSELNISFLNLNSSYKLISLLCVVLLSPPNTLWISRCL